MTSVAWKLLFCWSRYILFVGFIFLSSCTMFPHADDPNYTLCKTIQGKIQFSANPTIWSSNPTSTYSQTAASQDVAEEKDRLQATYDKLDCSKYQWFRF